MKKSRVVKSLVAMAISVFALSMSHVVQAQPAQLKKTSLIIDLKTFEILQMTAVEAEEFRRKYQEENKQAPTRYLLGHLELTKINSGSFTMGSSDPEALPDERPHRVTLTQEFWMGVFELTQEQWKMVMLEKDKNKLTAEVPPQGRIEIPILRRGAMLPMTNVTHAEATQFCQILTERCIKAKQSKNPAAFNFGRDMEFRLPTEAQWEYACRAGTATTFSCGEMAVLLGRYANCDEKNLRPEKRPRAPQAAKNANNENRSYEDGSNQQATGSGKYLDAANHLQAIPASILQLRNVATKAPNQWGLYDMHGNVWEWCRGYYQEYTSNATDPQGANRGRAVARGGGWYSQAKECRSARRYDLDPKTAQNNIGFRVILIKKGR